MVCDLLSWSTVWDLVMNQDLLIKWKCPDNNLSLSRLIQKSFLYAEKRTKDVKKSCYKSLWPKNPNKQTKNQTNPR